MMLPFFKEMGIRKSLVSKRNGASGLTWNRPSIIIVRVSPFFRSLRFKDILSPRVRWPGDSDTDAAATGNARKRTTALRMIRNPALFLPVLAIVVTPLQMLNCYILF